MQIIRTFLSSLRDNKGKQQWRSVIAGKSGGTSRWSHGFGYLFGAFRRDGLISDQLSLQLPTFFRSLDLFLKLRVRTVPHSLTTNQPRHSDKQDEHGPELWRCHPNIQYPRARSGPSSENNTGLVDNLFRFPCQTLCVRAFGKSHLIYRASGEVRWSPALSLGVHFP
jgi:hypothetical protein